MSEIKYKVTADTRPQFHGSRGKPTLEGALEVCKRNEQLAIARVLAFQAGTFPPSTIFPTVTHYERLSMNPQAYNGPFNSDNPPDTMEDHTLDCAAAAMTAADALAKVIHNDNLSHPPQKNRRVGIFAGCFDPFPHPGHLWAIRQAIEEGGCTEVIIALHSDPSVERPEKSRVYLSAQERKTIMESIKGVSEVIIYDTEKDLCNLIEEYEPEVRILGDDYLAPDGYDGDTVLCREGDGAGPHGGFDYECRLFTGHNLTPYVFIAKRFEAWTATEMRDRIKEDRFWTSQHRAKVKGHVASLFNEEKREYFYLRTKNPPTNTEFHPNTNWEETVKRAEARIIDLEGQVKQFKKMNDNQYQQIRSLQNERERCENHNANLVEKIIGLENHNQGFANRLKHECQLTDSLNRKTARLRQRIKELYEEKEALYVDAKLYSLGLDPAWYTNEEDRRKAMMEAVTKNTPLYTFPPPWGKLISVPVEAFGVTREAWDRAKMRDVLDRLREEVKDLQAKLAEISVLKVSPKEDVYASHYGGVTIESVKKAKEALDRIAKASGSVSLGTKAPEGWEQHSTYKKIKAPSDFINSQDEWITSNEDCITFGEALYGHRGQDQQRIAQTALSFVTLILRKNADYGSSVFESPVLCPGMDPGTSILVRASDKIKRLSTLLSGKSAEVPEALEDTIRDLGAYCVLWLARPQSPVPVSFRYSYAHPSSDYMSLSREGIKEWLKTIAKNTSPKEEEDRISELAT